MATMGFHPVVRDLFDLPPARLRLHPSRRLPAGFAGDFLHGPRRAFRQRRPDAPRPVRHRLPALRCRTCIAMAPKDEDELVDMMFTATHQNHPTFIRYPRGAAEGVPIKEQPKLLEIGKAEVIQNFSSNGETQGRPVRPRPDDAPSARKAAAQLAAEGFDVAVINPRFTKPLDAGHDRIFRQGGRCGRDAGRPCADGRLRLGGAGTVQRERCDRRRSCASAGRTNSSSTPRRRTNCGRNTA